MVATDPIDPRVRLAISQWPEDAPRGAVSTFCDEHGISRKFFYELRKRALVEGPAAVLEPKSRRPGWTTARSACTRRCARWAWTRSPRRRRWRGSSVRPALLGWSRARGHV